MSCYTLMMEESARKRPRRLRDPTEEQDFDSIFSESLDDPLPFPKKLESTFAAAVFEMGLKNSSPKLLIPFMPADSALNTEHIKSHLQKYRIHKQRSKDEFCVFYENLIQPELERWENSTIASTTTGSNSSCCTSVGSDDSMASRQTTPQEVQQAADTELELKQKELARLQEVLRVSTSMLDQWKQLCHDMSENCAFLSRELVQCVGPK